MHICSPNISRDTLKISSRTSLHATFHSYWLRFSRPVSIKELSKRAYYHNFCFWFFLSGSYSPNILRINRVSSRRRNLFVVSSSQLYSITAWEKERGVYNHRNKSPERRTTFKRRETPRSSAEEKDLRPGYEREKKRSIIDPRALCYIVYCIYHSYTCI